MSTFNTLFPFKKYFKIFGKSSFMTSNLHKKITTVSVKALFQFYLQFHDKISFKFFF